MSGLPYTVANGTCVHNEEVEQVWERPWSLDEIRKTSANWSLAADSGLFLFLQDFSQRMLSRTHEIEKQLDGLIRDTKATDCCLHSVFNDFLMLSNTQFIENRVYDEEVEEGAPKPEAAERQPEQEKTREQKEAELIPKVQEAVNYGLRVLESAFEQLDIKAGNSDSEDEEAIDRVEPILEPKDLYLDRPLPYLIGSQLFMEQDDVGLGDLSSEEMSMDSDRDSVIDSEEDKDEDQSDDDFDQNEEGQGSVKKKSSVMSDEEDVEDDDEDDSDIFGESDKEDDEDDKKSSAGPSSFADELAARIKGDTASKPEVDRSPLTSAPSSTKKSKGKRESKAEKAQVVDDSDDLFKPPDMEDEEFSPFGGRGGLFSGGTGLFDDDDEGDLFSDVPKNYPEGGMVKTATDKEPVSSKSNKKIPVGAVSIFPENAPFGSTSDSDLSERKGVSENKPQAAVKKAPLGGLFDDDEEDDFFSGNAIKKSSSVGQAKPKQKKVLDLFGGDEDNDEDGDIFNKSSSAAPEEVEVEEESTTKMPERKMPAGATSMFGAQTKNLLQDALRRREGAGRSEESIPSADAAKPTEETQARSLFSDDEDSQIFPSSKSQSRHEPAAKNEKNKAPLSIFDDEEEEDLFATAPPKLRTNKVKTEVPKQASKPVSSTLFSDDEDQWLSSKPSAAKSGVKSGGMKGSVSAPSSLPSVKAPQKQSTRSLFDDDDDDLFAATKDSSQKKSQRVSLLFEEEDEVEGRGLLFGVNPASGNTAPNTSATPPSVPSLFDSNVAEDEVSKPARETPPPGEVLQTQATQNARMPTGAVGLFGGIDVLGEKPVTVKQTKSPLDDLDEDDFVYKDGPPPMDEKPKAKKKVLSLFDDEDEEDDEEEAMPTPVPDEPVAKNTLKPQEQRSRARSTGVFKDEELLFSQKQQKDNDPDVDLFATSAKLPVPKPSSNRPAAPLLFADDDEGDLFGPTKSQAPPKAPEKPPKPSKEGFAIRAGSSVPAADGQTPAIPVKSKEPSSRIGKLQANLAIDPSSLLPSAVPRLPRETVTFPGQPSDTATCSAPQMSREGGVSFDKPAQVATLQSANKGRPKGAGHRRPQTRAARHLAAQLSDEHRGDGGPQPGSSGAPLKGASSPREDSAHQPGSSGAQSNGGGSPREDGALQPGSSLGQPSLQPRVSDTPAKPSVLRLPSPTPLQSASPESGEDGSISTPSEDLFKSDDLFATSDKQVPTAKPETKTPEGAPSIGLKKEVPPSIFDDHGGDLFEKVKRKPAKKPKTMPFLDEDDDDLFTTRKGHGVKKSEKTEADSPKHAIFQDEVKGDQIPKKTKEKVLDASLFDDNVDIFADLTATAAPKEKKSKKKVETKSIFDDDMDDIFSPSNVKAVAKSQSRSKATQPVQDPSATEDTGLSIFDDPLNALGGV